MKTASCPSCGAPVGFRSAASLYAVCAYCRSTLLRHGDELENLGRMAELIEDASLLQIGSEGRFRGQHFAVIGRIQLKHEAGVWNEWHILFDDGRSAWLSEAGGEYVVSAQVAAADADIPAFADLKPEMAVSLAGRSFTVSDLETARCVSGQGELPFKVEAGYDVNTADLRGNGRFVTIDYSETPPLVFVGHPAKFDELKLVKLREPQSPESGGSVNAPNIRAQAFNCPHCASPLTIHSPAIESLGCAHCGAIIGVENEKLRLLARAAQTVHELPLLPLGSKGKLKGIDWEAIGFLKRRTTVAGIDYVWSEYLLFAAGAGFAWLVEEAGHWNCVRTLSQPPGIVPGQERFKLDGELYRRFNSGRAEVTYVVGEFYWRVAVGETCESEDFVAPPLMLSREKNDREVSWSQGEYLPAADVEAAFALASPLPAAVGVYANQPNPWIERHRGVCRRFWQLALVATALQLAFVFFGAAGVVLKHRLVFSPTQDEVTLTTPVFVLPAPARTLAVRHQTDIANNWLSLSTTLVDKNSGQAWLGMQELAHYSGVDDGERWSEGAKGDEIVFKAIPPGTYYLAIDYELGSDRRASVVDRIEVARNAPGWSNYALLLIFLVAFPLVSRWRRNAFETRRWSGSGVADDSEGGNEGGNGGDDE